MLHIQYASYSLLYTISKKKMWKKLGQKSMFRINTEEQLICEWERDYNSIFLQLPLYKYKNMYNWYEYESNIKQHLNKD